MVNNWAEFFRPTCKRLHFVYNYSMKNESEKIIDALGGVAALAVKLNLPRPTIQAWKKRGIPAKIQLAYPKLIAKARRIVKAGMEG